MPLLVELLQSGGEGARCAAGALVYLAWNDDNKVAIAAAGGIAPLVELVRSGCADAKGSAARALANLASGNADNQVAIAAAGGIAPLVDLLRDGCVDGKGAAAHTLQILARNNADNKVAIAAAGAIAPLVALMRSGRGKGATYARRALQDLASGNVDNEVLIAAANGEIAKLVQIAMRLEGRFTAAAKNAAAEFLARRRRSIVNKCVDGKVPAELEPIIAACLARRGFS
ncbi:hypothetical protein SO694_00028367 [Aureococcus anophagefferens]|uniref:Uncharacterized protein n=1 Tax=Aureococcus anophagefferens TaxID=44056 RepID=A0ABR1FVW9_AURAN